MTNRMPTELSVHTPLRPAGYSSTDAAEVEAINVLRAALDPTRIKADLKERDKHPNTDGYLELVDDHGIPVGKLEVQVRKIPAGAKIPVPHKAVCLHQFNRASLTSDLRRSSERNRVLEAFEV
jgi:hypothetical protein